jgi:hypothetical protein
VDLDEKDKFYSVKKANFLDTDPVTYKEYKLVQDFEDEGMSELLAYCRLIAFAGESHDLIEASKQALDHATDVAEETDADGLPEYAYNVFKEPHDLKSEVDAWKYIRAKL